MGTLKSGCKVEVNERDEFVGSSKRKKQTNKPATTNDARKNNKQRKQTKQKENNKTAANPTDGSSSSGKEDARPRLRDHSELVRLVSEAYKLLVFLDAAARPPSRVPPTFDRRPTASLLLRDMTWRRDAIFCVLPNVLSRAERTTQHRAIDARRT